MILTQTNAPALSKHGSTNGVAKYFFGLVANCWRDHPLCQQCTSAATLHEQERRTGNFRRWRENRGSFSPFRFPFFLFFFFFFSRSSVQNLVWSSFPRFSLQNCGKHRSFEPISWFFDNAQNVQARYFFFRCFIFHPSLYEDFERWRAKE